MCPTHKSVCLYVSSESVDAVAQALVHDVDVATQLPSVVSLAHVAAVIVPTGALLGELEEGLIPRRDVELCRQARGERREQRLGLKCDAFTFLMSGVSPV